MILRVQFAVSYLNDQDRGGIDEEDCRLDARTTQKRPGGCFSSESLEMWGVRGLCGEILAVLCETPAAK